MESSTTLSDGQSTPSLNRQTLKKAISLIPELTLPTLTEIRTNNGQVFIEKLQELNILDEVHQRTSLGSMYFGIPLIEDDSIPVGEVHIKDSEGNIMKKFKI